MTYDDIFKTCRNMEMNNIYGWDTASILKDDATFENDGNGLDSHLTKNSEWAAVCFLANSKYGVNKLVVNSGIDISNDKITGKSSDVTTVYTTNANVSTTHNVYGIYDISSSIWDAVSAYTNTANNIGSTAIVNAQDKYKNVYNAPLGISYTINYSSKDSIYGIFKYINGQALYECSTSGNASTTAWFKGRSNIGSYSSKYQLLFTRGGSYNNIASPYAFGYAYGEDKSAARSFRPVIAVASGI